jgi:DNA-directed RNA polymerase specialized sigma24 family protein
MVMGERALAGRSLEDVYRAERLPLTRLAYLLTGDREAAEEIVQDAFAATHRSWANVLDPVKYLRTAVVNRSRSWGRRRRLELLHRSTRVEPVVLVADELWDALGRLSPRRRAAVVLRYYADLPDHEIAEVLGCRLATVRTVIHRALIDLRKELGNEG